MSTMTSCEIKLSEAELELAGMLARCRSGVSRKDGISNQRISTGSDYEVEYVGACGELAVARSLGVYPDLSVYSRSGGYDLLSRGGKRMEVKTTRHHDGRLLARPKAKVEDSDYYVLVTGDPPDMSIRGYIPTQEFIIEERIGVVSSGYPEAYIARQGELKPWPTTISDTGPSTNTPS